MLLATGIAMGTLCLCIPALVMLTPYLIKKTPGDPKRDSLSLEESALLRPGDLILIAGLRHSADLIISALRETRPFSHIGMLVARSDGLGVLHSVHGALTGIDGVQENTLRDFTAFARPASILVVRPLWISLAQAAAACSLAEQKLAARIPFDDRYDRNSDGALYCSEFIARILDGAGFWNAAADGRYKAGIFIFASFLAEERFVPIINHAQETQAE